MHHSHNRLVYHETSASCPQFPCTAINELLVLLNDLEKLKLIFKMKREREREGGRCTSTPSLLMGKHVQFFTLNHKPSHLLCRLLSSNQIHTIERGAFQDLVGVEKLRMNNNQIRYLPDLLFSNMMNLKRL